MTIKKLIKLEPFMLIRPSFHVRIYNYFTHTFHRCRCVSWRFIQERPEAQLMTLNSLEFRVWKSFDELSHFPAFLVNLLPWKSSPRKRLRSTIVSEPIVCFCYAGKMLWAPGLCQLYSPPQIHMCESFHCLLGFFLFSREKASAPFSRLLLFSCCDNVRNMY